MVLDRAGEAKIPLVESMVGSNALWPILVVENLLSLLLFLGSGLNDWLVL